MTSPTNTGQRVAGSLVRPYLWPHDYGWRNALRPRHLSFEPLGRDYLNGSTQYCQRSNYRRDCRVMLAYQRGWR